MRNGGANPFGICSIKSQSKCQSSFTIKSKKSERISSTIPHSSFLIPNSCICFSATLASSAKLSVIVPDSVTPPS